MPASRAGAIPSQIDTSQFHPEFGYFAPTIRLRRQVALTLKGAALGTLLGAVAMFFMVMDREEKGLRMLAAPMMPTSSKAAAVPKSAPVPFVPESIALPVVASAPPHVPPVAPQAVTAVAPVPVQEAPAVSESLATPGSTPVSEPAPAATPVAEPAPSPAPVRAAPVRAAPKAVAKRKRKIIREPAEPDGRTAFAGPYRRYGEPYPPGYSRPFFGFGW